jgi:hypothetical protein
MIHYPIFSDCDANDESIKGYKEREEVWTFYVNYEGRLSVLLDKGVLLKDSSTLTL